MPLFKIEFDSKYLVQKSIMNVYIPDNIMDDFQNHKVLLLFHGMNGDENDWIRYGNLIHIANQYQIIVIMPRMMNSFGVNAVHGNNYSAYIIEEIYEYAHRWLNLSRKKEDNYLAGLSMGGYITLYNGLKNQNLFSYLGSFSAPLDVNKIVNVYQRLEPNKRIYHTAFGEGDFSESELNIPYLVKNSSINSKIFLYCGTSDERYDTNVEVFELLKQKNADVIFMDDDGNHTWDRWEKYLKEFLERVPKE